MKCGLCWTPITAGESYLQHVDVIDDAVHYLTVCEPCEEGRVLDHARRFAGVKDVRLVTVTDVNRWAVANAGTPAADTCLARLVACGRGLTRPHTPVLAGGNPTTAGTEAEVGRHGR